MITKRAIPLLIFFLCMVACDQKKGGLTSHTMSIAVDPSSPQTVTTGSRTVLKAACTGIPAENTASPAWSVENNLGTFEPAQGKETTFIAGNTSGTGKIYAACGSVRGETTVTVGAGGCSGNTGGSTGSGGCDDNLNASYYGLFSETYIIPGILLDTDSSRFRNGGCIGVWPDGQNTTLCDATGKGEMSEGTKSLKCTVGNGGGWWLQFGSDGVAGLDKNDVMKAKDMSAFAGGSLKFDVKTPKDVLIELKWGNSTPLSSAYYTLRELGIAHDNQWHSVSIPLSSFAGIDLKTIKIPASFSAAPGCINFSYYVDNVRWEK